MWPLIIYLLKIENQDLNVASLMYVRNLVYRMYRLIFIDTFLHPVNLCPKDYCVDRNCEREKSVCTIRITKKLFTEWISHIPLLFLYTKEDIFH